MPAKGNSAVSWTKTLQMKKLESSPAPGTALELEEAGRLGSSPAPEA